MSFYKKIILLTLSLGCFLLACKKEIALTAQRFGKINFGNQTLVNPLIIDYNGTTISVGLDLTKNIKVPIGKGKLSFKDDKGKVLTDTIITVEENGIKNLVLFQPSSEAKPALVENTQENEPKPEEGFMKIKIANLAQKCLPKNVDIIIKMFDNNLGDFADLDTIENVSSNFGGYTNYKTFTPVTGDGYLIFYIIDSTTKQPLHEGFAGVVDINDYNNGIFYNIITLYINEQTVEASGANMVGTDGKPYQVQVNALFMN
ncbi:hypothetical protein [Pedobacter panaciterrae]|jgi:hypothetical protein|uniref:Lipoprotein n=1 Tax=Pedobacter panaciterrae TaxID=363849 RepID=A0ABU8NNP5_9SPHI|nr:hypothetical protein [Pedobacter panaciterrae]NQX53155.1 hypothetical protein [Pedobacter panaciterrae]